VENESYGLRLEKKIDTLQSEIRTLTDHITRHTFVNEANQHKIEENRKVTEALDGRVSSIESRQSIQDGGISVIKYILALLAVFFLLLVFGLVRLSFRSIKSMP